MFKILIVEDDDALRETARNWVTWPVDLMFAMQLPMVLRCRSCYSKKNKPDLILTGSDVARQRTESRFVHETTEETSGVPIIMLTARTEDTDMIRGLEAGADDYVTKPYKIEVLVSRIKARLRPLSGRSQHTNHQDWSYRDGHPKSRGS